MNGGEPSAVANANETLTDAKGSFETAPGANTTSANAASGGEAEFDDAS